MLAVLLLLAAAPAIGPSELPERVCKNYEADPRLTRLLSFFQTYDCPAREHAEEFILAADLHGLDWRLLPSIAFVETGAGKTSRGNNLFGWDSGRQEFPSVPHAIHWVAWRLASSKLYAGKTPDSILRTYNPRSRYAGLVQFVMKQIAAE
jgi:hypothetical protein